MDFHFIAFNLGNKRLVTIMAPASGKRLLRHSINIKGTYEQVFYSKKGYGIFCLQQEEIFVFSLIMIAYQS